jgi:hypothetical protein
MKRFNLISMVAVLVLLVTAVSCSSVQGTQDDYYSQQPARRVYVEDPYRGTVVLERDPYTGRYYEVNTVGTYGADPYYNNRVYRSGGYNTNRNVYHDNRYRNNNTYRNNYPNRNTQPATPQQSQEQKRQDQQNRQDARKKVLGN